MPVDDRPNETFRITARTRVIGVIGHPVRHSLSPVIHNAGFRSTGVDFVYVAFDVTEGEAHRALEAVRVLDLSGLSVTMPHKTEVANEVDVLAEAARRLDSVNTVEVGESGQLIGHSTDGDGLIASLLDHDVSVAGLTVSVLGAGGAARSVVDALVRHGAATVHLVNRTLEAAERACRLGDGRARALSSNDASGVREALSSSDLVVNATSVGMAGTRGSTIPLDPTLLSARHVVVDLVYHPIRTELLEVAESKGCRIVDGLGMLVHQAALQQVIWTGSSPDVAEMTRVATQALQ